MTVTDEEDAMVVQKTPQWDGYTDGSVLIDSHRAARNAPADSARARASLATQPGLAAPSSVTVPGWDGRTKTGPGMAARPRHHTD